MSTLTIRHLPGTDPPQFELRDPKGKTTTAADVPRPPASPSTDAPKAT